jgi:recombination protein RecA
MAPPFKRVEMEIIFGKGISAEGSLLDAAIQYNIITKSGSWYSFGEERIGQGRENVKTFLQGNPDMYQQIEQNLRKLLFTPAGAPPAAAAPGADKSAAQATAPEADKPATQATAPAAGAAASRATAGRAADQTASPAAPRSPDQAPGRGGGPSPGRPSGARK